ncbi:MAG: hypothetical protein AB8B64_09980 [Granulosicoccus sp.]
MTIKLSDRDTFYEKMYFHEITERDRLDDRFRTLLAIVAIVFAMIGYLFNAIVLGSENVPLLFWAIYGIAAISFTAAIVCYIKAWHSQHYYAFPRLGDIEDYVVQIRHHYQDHFQDESDKHHIEQYADKAFKQFMRQSFIDHASYNSRANDSKRFWMYYGNSFIVNAFVFCVMAFIPVSNLLVQ